MPSHGNQVNTNFLYGSQGRRKRRRPSFWGCKSCKRNPPARERNPGQETPTKPMEPSPRSEAARERSPPRPARQAYSNPARLGRHSLAAEHDIMDGGGDRPDYWPSPIGHQEYYSPQPPSSAQARDRWPVMQPFRTLVAFVKRCPWAVVSDLGPRGQSASDDVYYPSVPRSLLHDTAVSFVVKDHTRPDLPEFVISCPFEHVDLVHQLLAPDGSRRQLSARGTSGQPRNGDQLRSMLLDGTPSIELALHTDAGGGIGGPRNRRRPWPSENQADPAFWFGSGGGRDTRSQYEPPNIRSSGNPNTRGRNDTGTSGWTNGEVNNAWGQHTSPMSEPDGLTEELVINSPGGLLRADDSDVEHARTNEVLAEPPWTATPLRAPMTPVSSSPQPPSSEPQGRAFSYFSPGPLHFQATVESAPPTPSTEPVKLGLDDPAAVLENGDQEDGNEDQMERNRDQKQESPGGMGEPPALVYVQPSPGQLESGVPLTGWLCDPEWLRHRFRDFTLRNTQGNQ